MPSGELSEAPCTQPSPGVIDVRRRVPSSSSGSPPHQGVQTPTSNAGTGQHQHQQQQQQHLRLAGAGTGGATPGKEEAEAGLLGWASGGLQGLPGAGQAGQQPCCPTGLEGPCAPAACWAKPVLEGGQPGRAAAGEPHGAPASSCVRLAKVAWHWLCSMFDLPAMLCWRTASLVARKGMCSCSNSDSPPPAGFRI